MVAEPLVLARALSIKRSLPCVSSSAAMVLTLPAVFKPVGSPVGAAFEQVTLPDDPVQRLLTVLSMIEALRRQKQQIQATINSMEQTMFGHAFTAATRSSTIMLIALRQRAMSEFGKRTYASNIQWHSPRRISRLGIQT